MQTNRNKIPFVKELLLLGAFLVAVFYVSGKPLVKFDDEQNSRTHYSLVDRSTLAVSTNSQLKCQAQPVLKSFNTVCLNAALLQTSVSNAQHDLYSKSPNNSLLLFAKSHRYHLFGASGKEPPLA